MFSNFGLQGAAHQRIGYVHEAAGYIEPEISDFQPQDSTNIVLNEDASITFDGTSTTVINNNAITTTNLTSDTINTQSLTTEELNLGRYIYLNSQNAYSDTTMDSGMVLNLETLPDLSTAVNSTGFFSTSQVHVALATGLLPTQFLAVQSTLNTGLYEVLLHAGNVITINTSPQEPFCSGSFVVEPANGKVRAINVGVIRYNRDPLNDTFTEIAKGSLAPLSYHAALFDTKPTGELGALTLTDTSNQLVLNKATITAAGTTARTHNILDTANDQFTMNIATQTLTHKTIMDNTNTVRATHLAHASGQLQIDGYTAPTSGQMLTSGSWKTPFQVIAGEGLLGGTGGGTSNSDITLSLDKNVADDTPGPKSNPATPGTGAGDPITLDLTIPIAVGVALAVAGAIAAGAVVAGAVVAGEEKINGNSTITGLLTAGNITTPGTLTADSVVTNSLTVGGVAIIPYSSVIDNLPMNESATNVNITYNIDNRVVIATLQPFSFTLASESDGLFISGMSLYNSSISYFTSCFLQVNGVWEECILHMSTVGEMSIFRRDASNFLNTDVIRYGLDDYISSKRMISSIVFNQTI